MGASNQTERKGERIEQDRQKKVMIVERNGDQVSQILTSSNPWGEQRCSREIPDCHQENYEEARNKCQNYEIPNCEISSSTGLIRPLIPK